MAFERTEQQQAHVCRVTGVPLNDAGRQCYQEGTVVLGRIGIATEIVGDAAHILDRPLLEDSFV